jgi:hypothetical protein
MSSPASLMKKSFKSNSVNTWFTMQLSSGTYKRNPRIIHRRVQYSWKIAFWHSGFLAGQAGFDVPDAFGGAWLRTQGSRSLWLHDLERIMFCQD